MINIKIEVKNLAWNENLSKRCNHSLLPKGITGLIIGNSGYGKTTLLTNLLLRPGWLDYNNINIFGKCVSTRVSYPQESFEKSYQKK